MNFKIKKHLNTIQPLILLFKKFKSYPSFLY